MLLLALRWALRIVGLLLVLAVAGTLYVAGRIWWTGRQDDHPRSDAIVVLGASQYNGRPSKIFEARLAHARALYEQHVAPYVVTVGGNEPGDNYTEGGTGARWLTAHGVPDSAVIAVPTGSDTLNSVKAVADVFRSRHWRTAVLVTDPWHAFRADTMADDNGIDAKSSPVHSGPAVQGRGTEVRYIFREAAAYIWYELFGGSRERGPSAA